MRGLCIFGRAVTFMLVSACGGSSEPAQHPEQQLNSESPRTEEPSDVTVASNAAKAGHGDSADAPKDANAAPAAPTFKENGSVKEAVDAVPAGTPRLNIEQEALGRPLGNVELYEACKPGTMHFKAKVAVWDGKAVGLDLTTTPKNQKFADCIAEKIRGITWPDKVKSLNTVEYMF